MKRYLYSTLFFLLFSFNTSVSQELNSRYIDSVYELSKNKVEFKEDKVINDIFFKSFELSLKEGLKIYHYLDSISEGNAYVQLNYLDDYAALLQREGRVLESRDLNLLGLKIAEKENAIKFIFKYNHLLAYHYTDRAITDSALYYIQNAEKILNEHTKTMYKSWPVVYERRSHIEALLGNFEKRDDYLDQTIAFTDTIENYPNRAFLLAQVTYHYKVTKNYKKHAVYSSKLKAYYLKENDFKFPELHSSIQSIISFEETDEHISELKKILADQELSNDSNTYHILVSSLSEALIAKKKYDEAISYLSKYNDPNYKHVNIYNRILSLSNLEEAYLKLSDYQNAYNTIGYRKTLQDSVRRIEMLDKVADYEVKYETNQKEAQLKLVSLENKKNKQQKSLYSIIAIGGLIASIIIGFLLFINRKKNKQLVKQKHLLEVTLDEKNVLLKEIHHRVKNSFQIVSSLLYLQSENIEDKEAQLAIKEAENRVRSMVLIHQKLYSKDDLVGINTKEYIEDLTKDIMDSHQSNNKSISYDLKIEPKVLDIETITPLGLILNELITNVLKHAFPEVSEKNKMSIEFKQDNDELVLSVSDNGVGMPTKVRESSFGLKLIRALSKKLKANLNFNSDGAGTMAQVRMKRFEILS